MVKKDIYISNVIVQGDKGSKLLAAITAPTLKNSQFVEVLDDGMNGTAVLRLPRHFAAVVHSTSGDPSKKNMAKHAASLVDRLVEQAKTIGATPIAFANVIDSRTGDNSLIKDIGASLAEKADRGGYAIMNGENAVLGDRMNCDANVSGTMISVIDESKIRPGLWIDHKFRRNNNHYALFFHDNMPIYMNSDGVGTKVEFYERKKRYGPAVIDFMAMNLDDAGKKGATAKVISGVAETKGSILVNDIRAHADRALLNTGIISIIQHEEVGDRIMGYTSTAPAFNLSGSVVSIIDEKRLRNPPKPAAGEYLVAIRGKPNPRSNGITDKRKIVVKLFGREYHKTAEGKLFLEYLAEPSTLLYPLFKELVDNGLATSCYHMSGGAYNGKLARPLAKHSLFASIDELFEPDWRELALSGANFTSAETAYAKWPMGNDGFITTNDPERAMAEIRNYGLEAKVVGKIRSAKDGKTGVELTAYNGEKVYFSGRD